MSWPDDEHVASSADYFQGIYDNYHPTTGFVSDVDAQIDWYNSCELGQNENAQWSDDTNTYQCTNSEWRVISRPSRSAGPPPLRSVALTTPNCSHTAGDGVAYVGGADIIAMQLWFGINGPYKLLDGITRWSAWQGGVYTGAAASAVALGLWAWDHRAC